jgi:hypothetical protein
MHWIFAALRFYPYWALPAALLCFELGVFFRRRLSSIEWAFWGAVGFFVVSTLLWFGFRGDVNSDRWLKAILQLGLG